MDLNKSLESFIVFYGLCILKFLLSGFRAEGRCEFYHFLDSQYLVIQLLQDTVESINVTSREIGVRVMTSRNSPFVANLLNFRDTCSPDQDTRGDWERKTTQIFFKQMQILTAI